VRRNSLSKRSTNAGECTHVESAFANQHKTLPVRLEP
jgi:hypothetical protein